MRQAAEFIADALRNVGMENVEIIGTDRHSLVHADWMHAPGKPTILFTSGPCLHLALAFDRAARIEMAIALYGLGALPVRVIEGDRQGELPARAAEGSEGGRRGIS